MRRHKKENLISQQHKDTNYSKARTRKRKPTIKSKRLESGDPISDYPRSPTEALPTLELPGHVHYFLTRTINPSRITRGAARAQMQKALTRHGFNAHTQQYLLTTGISAQVLLWAGKPSQSRGTEISVLPVHPCLGLTPLWLKAAHTPISQPPKFQGWEGFSTAGAVGGWVQRGRGVGQSCFTQVGNNRSKTKLEHKLVSTQSKAICNSAQE